MKKVIIFLVLFLALASQAKAAENVYLAEDEVAEGNYYAIGNMVEVLGTVNSDLIIIANNAVVKGLVKGDVLAIGGNIKINGEVDGNIRAVGGEIEINGKVGKNVLAAGGYLMTGENSEINGNLTFAFGNVKLDGLIQGRVDGAGGNLVFNNEVKGDVNLRTGRDGKIVLMPKTNFVKDFYYRAPDEAVIKEGAKVNGTTHFQPIEITGKKFITKSYLFGKVISLFSLLLVGLLLISLFLQKVDEITELMIQKPIKNLWQGLLFLIVTPILAFILMLTIIGLPLALISLTWYLMILYISQIFIGLVIGHTFLKSITTEPKPIYVLIVGLIIYEILIAIPFIGWLIRFIGLLWASGAVFEIIKPLFRKEKTV